MILVVEADMLYGKQKALGVLGAFSNLCDHVSMHDDVQQKHMF